jgi:hypothetical protein
VRPRASPYPIPKEGDDGDEGDDVPDHPLASPGIPIAAFTAHRPAEVHRSCSVSSRSSKSTFAASARGHRQGKGRRLTGRPASIDEARVRELKAQGMRPTDIAKTMGIGRTSGYRAL